MHKNFYGLWLFLGFFQIVLGFGCLSANALFEDNLFSSNSPADAATDSSLPVRISRSFLDETELTGSVEVQIEDNQSDSLQFQSPASWEQEPTQLPSPVGQFLADYRDFQGCLNYANLQGVAVCFNVMPDVSSVGINSKEMKLHGMEEFMNKKLAETSPKGSCTFEVNAVSFEKAERLDKSFLIHFSGTAATKEQDCSPAQKHFRASFLIGPSASGI